MGLFGRNKDKPSEPTSTGDTANGIDFTKYELDELGADIRSIVDVPGAIGQAAKYALTIPFIVVIITWAVFSSRMAAWVFVPFSIITFFLSFFGALVIGGFFVARKRLDIIADASSRVVDVIGTMHADVVQVKDGHSGTSVQQVAVGLLENAIFPAFFGTINSTAEATLGPLGRLTSSITKAPLNMVQKSVISAIGSLPDREIGQLVTDVGAAVPQANAGLQRLTTEYENVRDKIDGIVAKVSRTALGSVLGFALVASVPLAVWLIIGWVAS